MKRKQLNSRERSRMAFLLDSYADMLSCHIEAGAWEHSKREMRRYRKEISDCYKFNRKLIQL